MPLTITGKLINPVGLPVPNAEIRFRAVSSNESSEGEIIPGVESISRCGADGSYTITLEYCRYEIATKTSTPNFMVHGRVTIDKDTQAQDLEDLIALITVSDSLTNDLIRQFEQIKFEAETARDEAEQAVKDAEAQVQLATQQADRAELAADRAENYLMSETEAMAQADAYDNIFAASGMVNSGKQIGASTYPSVNEGINVSTASATYANQIIMGSNYTQNLKGTSKTNFGVSYIAGAVANVLHNTPASSELSWFNLPPAEDGTRTFNKSTGESITHPDVATAFALASSDVNIEVVTQRVDQATWESYDEELTGRKEVMECIQSLSTTFGDTDVPTVLSTRPNSYFDQYEGQSADPDAQNTKYRCVVWDDLTDEQKRKVAAYMGNKLYMGENGNLINRRLRARTFRGLGNGDWANIDVTLKGSSFDQFLTFSKDRSAVQPQGVKDSVNSFTSSSGKTYATTQLQRSSNNTYSKGAFAVWNDKSYGYKGRCYMYVVASVPRACKAAYVKNLNESGTGMIQSKRGAGFSEFWYASNAVDVNTLQDTFTKLAPNTGAIGQSSGHPGGIFYDGITAGGLNGVIDRRLPAVANDTPEEQAKVQAKVENKTFRGLEKYLDVSMSGEFLYTYTETVGGSVTLPRECLDSTVECVHSSDGGSTWSRTIPSVNQVTNTVTLPVGGESVVSFKAMAKVVKPVTKKSVLNAAAGLLGIFVTQDHNKATLAEAVSGIILKSNASGIVTEQSNAAKFLVDGAISRIKTLSTDMVAPNNSSQAIKIAVYQISENGQVSLGIIANTMSHDGSDWGELEEMYIPSAESESFTDSNGVTQQATSSILSIPSGWTKNRARVGTQVLGVDL